MLITSAPGHGLGEVQVDIALVLTDDQVVAAKDFHGGMDESSLARFHVR